MSTTTSFFATAAETLHLSVDDKLSMAHYGRPWVDMKLAQAGYADCEVGSDESVLALFLAVRETEAARARGEGEIDLLTALRYVAMKNGTAR